MAKKTFTLEEAKAVGDQLKVIRVCRLLPEA